MSIEYIILIGVWVLSYILIYTIPRHKLRLAVVAFLFKQLITCLLGFAVVQLGLLSYPVRELPDVNQNSVTYEYLAYPIVCAVFNVHYPNGKSRLVQTAYYIAYSTALTIPEALLEHHTELITYIHWNWFCTWCMLMLTFFSTRQFCVWFFRMGRSSEQSPS